LAPFATVTHGRIESGANVGAHPWPVRGRRRQLSGVSIHYVVAADGTTNLPTPPEEPDLDQPSEMIDYLLRNAAVVDGHVRYEDHQRELDVTLAVASLEIDGQIATRRHDVRVTAGPGTATADGRRLELTTLDAAADVGRDSLVLERLTVAAAGSRLDISGGRLDGFDAPAIEAKVHGELDAAHLGVAGGLAEPLQGHLTVAAAAVGPLDALTITASGSGEGLSARGLAPAGIRFEGRYAHASRLATIDGMDVTAPWGRVVTSGRVALGAGESRIAARVDGRHRSRDDRAGRADVLPLA
jgi:hypothetical protein